MHSAVTISRISKTYSSVRALDDISLDVPQNSLFGLIGPDGAGKSTLFRILSTLILPDSGTAEVMGFGLTRDFRKIRDRIGYMPGRFSLYQDLTVDENLRFFATIYGTSIRENYHLIGDLYVQLEPFRNRPAGKLSGGMKQKLALCCALIHRPSLLILDEPTTGVDPVSRKEFWQMLKKLKAQDMTIMVSTAYMDEAGMCDQFALIQKGRILSVTTPDQIGRQFRGSLAAFKSARMYELLLALRSHPLVSECYAFGDYHHATFNVPEPNLDGIVSELKKQGFSDLEAKPISAGIENVFIQLLGESNPEKTTDG